MSTRPVTPLPGWWGKLPGTGDFSGRRLCSGHQRQLGDWLQDELGAMRARHSHWQSAYLAAPLWHFALGAGLLGDAAQLGVLMPSVDKVGRYFPLVILQALPEAGARTPGQWWERATATALQALAEDQGPLQLEQALAQHFADGQAAAAPLAPAESPAQPGHSIWHSAAGTALPLALAGWPRGAYFDLLFDLGGQPAALEEGA